MASKFAKFAEASKKEATKATSNNASGAKCLFGTPNKNQSPMKNEVVMNVQPMNIINDNGISELGCVAITKTYPINDFLKGLIQIPTAGGVMVGTFVSGGLIFPTKAHIEMARTHTSSAPMDASFLTQGGHDAQPRFFISAFTEGNSSETVGKFVTFLKEEISGTAVPPDGNGPASKVFRVEILEPYTITGDVAEECFFRFTSQMLPPRPAAVANFDSLPTGFLDQYGSIHPFIKVEVVEATSEVALANGSVSEVVAEDADTLTSLGKRRRAGNSSSSSGSA